MQITTQRTLLKNAFCLHPNSLTLSKPLPSLLFSTASVFTHCPNCPEHTPQWLVLGMLLIASPRKRNRPYGLNHKKIVCSLNQVPRNTGSQGRLRHSTVSSRIRCPFLHPVKFCPHACCLMVTRWLPQLQTSRPHMQHPQQEE